MIIPESTIQFHNIQVKLLYVQLCNNDPNKFLQIGIEEFSEVGYIKRIIGNIVKLTHSFLISINLLVNRVFKNHDTLLEYYQRNLDNNLNLINIDKFNSKKINIVSKQELHKRIHTLNTLYSLFNNLESVVYQNTNTSNWENPQIKSAFSELLNIGFDANKLNLVKKVSTIYDKNRVKQSIQSAGYSIDDIGDIISEIKQLSSFLSKKYINTISKKINDISEKLIQQRELENNSNTKKQIENKIMRLWWTSHFIKATYTISNDVISDILILCKTAVSCMDDEE